jgi:hypothetical protein
MTLIKQIEVPTPRRNARRSRGGVKTRRKFDCYNKTSSLILLDQEDLQWRQKAKENWLKEGDRNAKYFNTCELKDKRPIIVI